MLALAGQPARTGGEPESPAEVKEAKEDRGRRSPAGVLPVAGPNTIVGMKLLSDGAVRDMRKVNPDVSVPPQRVAFVVAAGPIALTLFALVLTVTAIALLPACFARAFGIRPGLGSHPIRFPGFGPHPFGV